MDKKTYYILMDIFLGLAFGFILTMTAVTFDIGNIQKANGLMYQSDCLVLNSSINAPVELYGENSFANGSDEVFGTWNIPTHKPSGNDSIFVLTNLPQEILRVTYDGDVYYKGKFVGNDSELPEIIKKSFKEVYNE